VRSDGRPVSEHVTDRLLTSAAVLEEELALQRWGAAHAQPAEAQPGDAQEADARAIAGYQRLTLVVGPAGAGKTTAVRQAVDAIRADGRAVFGLAPSGKAADVLEETAGCPAMTLEALLWRDQHGQLPPVPQRATVILDEAGMARTDDLRRLVGFANRHSLRLVCVGDPDQLPAVGRGGMFARWCDTLPVHELDRVHRFHDQWQAEASLALRRGDPEAAAEYAQRDRVTAVHPALLARDAARLHRQFTDRGEELAITTATAETARTINCEIQRARHQNPAHPSVALADETEARVGDRIATRAERPARHGARRRCSQPAHVGRRRGAAGRRDRRCPRRARPVHLPPEYVRSHVGLGWAVTGYGNQGITADHGLCIVERSSTRSGIISPSVVGSIPTGPTLLTRGTASPEGLGKPLDRGHPTRIQHFPACVTRLMAARKTPGMRERAPGVWEMIAEAGRDPVTGRRRQVSRTFRGSLREAKLARAELVVEASKGR
jgi:hypothetical protein